MIYVCVVTRDNAPTIGLLLWKVRKVLAEGRWEYQLLVADDGSGDETDETLDTYQRVLPLTVVQRGTQRGYAACMEALLRVAVERTDRPKRDCAITLPADFTVSPLVLPELLKRFASGADVVVGEALDSPRPLGERLVRRWAPWLLRPGLCLPGILDLTSGVNAFRLSTLKHCFEQREDPLLKTDGSCANAELAAWAATTARQIAAVPLGSHGAAPRQPRSGSSFALAMRLYRAGRRLKIPAPTARVQRA